MNLTYKELRELLREKLTFSNDGYVEWRDKQLVVNEGFPGTFNLSLAEPELLAEFGNFINYDHNLCFAKIQTVIRFNDFKEVVLECKDKKHLSVFEMAGFVLCDVDSNKLIPNTQKAIDLFYEILFEKLKLDPKKLYVKVCAGGKIEDVTSGRFKLEKIITKDTLTYDLWRKKGIPENNFIWDNSRSTFLSLMIYNRPTPWGYRNELLYDIGQGLDEDNLLDIGTIEYLPFAPIFSKLDSQELNYEMLKDFEPWKHSAVACGLGVERLLMAVNGYKNIMDCDHIKPLYDKIAEKDLSENKYNAFLFTDTLRAIQRIIIDSKGYNNLTDKRQGKLSVFVNSFYSTLKPLNIEIKQLETYFKQNAELQNVYPELSDIKFIIRDLRNIFERQVEDAPIWSRAEFHDADEGFKKIVDEIMEEKGRDVYAIVSSALFKVLPEESVNFRKRRIQNNIHLKVIIDRQNKEIKERHEHDKEELRELRFSNKFTNMLNTGIYIYGNKIAMISAAEKGKGGIIIENKEMTEMIRRLFWSTWTSLEPKDKKTEKI
jgi:hypothetical protein